MAESPAPAAGMEAFNAYFRQADLDRDGRISGAEAVKFFQRSNLPKNVLAQIWMHADQSRTGFLGREEFCNALKLVTVAQSGRELTPEIVKAALYGPAAAKIPAPKINPVAAPATQINMVAAPSNLNPTMRPPVQMGSMAPVVSQNSGFGGPRALPNAAPIPTQPVNALPVVNSGLSGKGSIASAPLPSPNMSNQTTNWLGGRTTGASVGGPSQIPVTGITPSINQEKPAQAVSGALSIMSPNPQTPTAPTSLLATIQQDPVPKSSQPAVSDSEALVQSGNGFASDTVFGGDLLPAAPKTNSDSMTPSFSASSKSNSVASPLPSSGFQNSLKPSQLDSLNNMLALPAASNQNQLHAPLDMQNQLGALQSSSTLATSNSLVGPASSASGQSEQPWPRFTQSDIKKYTAVFVEVDKDRDGKITGVEARNLFLSWRLPREVLKQVWDLSDQDNDSMLSLREFCTALYLMERFREGRTLPSVLPNRVKFDEALLQATGQTSNVYGGPTWPNPGLPQQGFPGSRPPIPSSGFKPPLPNSVSRTGGALNPLQQRPGFPVLDKNLLIQSHGGDMQSVLVSQSPKAEEKKVPQIEKQILDSKEKIEFYRTKMQELVLYKSRCDNRLNEITERASADKREVEALAKKYEEKYKQVGEIASKLAVEEATFRDVQERRLELQNAIVKMEQGGSVDGLLQVRADRIQSDLEELEKAMLERCKQHGLHIKQTASIELPFGWQPGIQEGAVDWDEEWDKFEDEGFTLSTDLRVEIENGGAGENIRSPSSRSEKVDEASPAASSSYAGTKMDKGSNGGSPVDQNGSAFAHSEESSARSPHSSPGRSTLESIPQLFHPANDFSPRAKESYSDHGGAESTMSGDRYADDHSWGPTFDANDDVDSVWGFNTKQSDYGVSGENSFFGSGDFGLNPIKVDSSSASVYGNDKKSPFFDSVPSTPAFNFASSPRFSEGPEDNSFDNSSRFDSFRAQDSGFPSQRETLTRFDSIRSTSDFGHSRGFTFDDTDPFGSMGPFKASDSLHSPRRDSDNWKAF